MPIHPLDNAVWWSLTGPHRRFAAQQGRAVRFLPEVSVFSGLPDEPRPQDWLDLAALHHGDDTVALFRVDACAAPGWTELNRFNGVQFVAPPGLGVNEPEVAVLSAGDVAAMTALVAATEPGPFAARTIELGTYVGFREGGELVAMAGQRLRLDGHVEISAVCTAPTHRGRGLAGRLVRHLLALIEADGDAAFLHAQADNAAAIALYDRLGLERRALFDVLILAPPR